MAYFVGLSEPELTCTFVRTVEFFFKWRMMEKKRNGETV
jgi:hypothetical protein